MYVRHITPSAIPMEKLQWKVIRIFYEEKKRSFFWQNMHFLEKNAYLRRNHELQRNACKFILRPPSKKKHQQNNLSQAYPSTTRVSCRIDIKEPMNSKIHSIHLLIWIIQFQTVRHFTFVFMWKELYIWAIQNRFVHFNH